MWNNIIGHKTQKEQLRQAIGSSTVPHAYLFTGISGIGKFLVAKTTATALLCNNDKSPCGKCANCTKVEKGIHPDCIEIRPGGSAGEKASLITIDLIRELKLRLHHSPLEAKRRAIIIDDADRLNINAANAALKILEEPPKDNHFFLVTSLPHLLPATIRSRCQHIQFSPLPTELIRDYLVSKQGIEPGEAEAVSGTTEGSIGRAMNITPELIESVTGELFQLLAKPSSTEIIDLSKRWSSEAERIENILYVLHRCFHDAVATSAGRRCRELSGDYRNKLAFITERNTKESLIEKLEIINRAHREANLTYNKQLMFEQLLFSLAF